MSQGRRDVFFWRAPLRRRRMAESPTPGAERPESSVLNPRPSPLPPVMRERGFGARLSAARAAWRAGCAGICRRRSSGLFFIRAGIRDN